MRRRNIKLPNYAPNKHMTVQNVFYNGTNRLRKPMFNGSRVTGNIIVKIDRELGGACNFINQLDEELAKWSKSIDAQIEDGIVSSNRTTAYIMLLIESGDLPEVKEESLERMHNLLVKMAEDNPDG